MKDRKEDSELHEILYNGSAMNRKMSLHEVNINM